MPCASPRTTPPPLVHLQTTGQYVATWFAIAVMGLLRRLLGARGRLLRASLTVTADAWGCREHTAGRRPHRFNDALLTHSHATPSSLYAAAVWSRLALVDAALRKPASGKRHSDDGEAYEEGAAGGDGGLLGGAAKSGGGGLTGWQATVAVALFGWPALRRSPVLLK